MHPTVLRVLLGVCALLAATVALNAPGASAQEEPQDVVEAFAAAVEAGDHAALVALLGDDAAFTEVSQIGGSFGAFGKPAVSFIFEEVVQENLEIELTDVDVDDETGVVTGVARINDDTSDAAGVDRFLQPFSITVVDGLMTAINFTYDENDAQTRTYLEYESDEDDGGGEEPIGELAIELGPGRDGNQPGVAFLFEGSPEVTGVGIAIAPGASGVLQPAHIHDGDCPGVGAIASPLASVLDGASFSFVSISLADLSAGDYAINVHQSAAQAAIYVSCGEVGAVEVEPTPAPAEPTSTAATGVVAPNTGAGPSGGSTAALAVAAMIVVAGVLAVGGGLFVARRRSAQ